MDNRFKDLTNMQFGRLKVISYFGKNKHGLILWNCECECGNKNIIVCSSNLLNGSTKSCGCLKSEIITNKNKKYNKYIIENDFVRMFTNNNEEFLIDIDDLNRVLQHCWSLDSKGYVRTSINRKQVMLHRFLIKTSDNSQIDHIDGNILNNRKSNLRICTKQQNSCNLKTPKNNTSGYKGVYLDKRSFKWYARINYKNKVIHLGVFDKFEDAVKARKEAEIKYFKDFKRDDNE
jgi:hypothetical protein